MAITREAQQQEPKEAHLERLLQLAADEPAHRPEFFSTLLESTIYLIGDTGQQNSESGEVTLEADSKLNICTWETQEGQRMVPFFTSLATLQQAIESQLPYLAMPATDFFEISLGSTLYLNPKSSYGKEFTPSEIKQLLHGSLDKPLSQQVIDKETEILIGQPENYPTDMVNSLKQLFVKHKKLKKAYVGIMYNSAVDEKPHLIVGIEVEGDIEQIISEAASVAVDTTPAGEIVDFFPIDLDDIGLSQYFIEDVEPFYTQSLGSKFSRFFGL